MDRLYVDERLNDSIVWFITALNGLSLSIRFGLFIFSPAFRNHVSYHYLVVILELINVLYNLIIYPRLKKRHPAGAVYLAMAPVVLALFIAINATGGMNSDYYYFWLVALAATGITGLAGTYLGAGVTGLYYLLAATLQITTGVNYLHNWQIAVASFASLIVSYWIATQINRMQRTVKIAESLTNQLDTAELKEQLMMSAIADALVGVDRERRVVLFNHASEELTGWDFKSAMGVDYNAIFSLKDSDDHELTDADDPFLQVIRTGKSVVANDFYMLGKNQEKVTFSMSIAPTFDTAQNIHGAIAVFHDISRQKAVERERNEFVSTASHEMRTPVAAIEGYLSMAMNDQLASTDERAKGFIRKAHEASLHLGQLFGDLLSVTKIDDKRLRDTPKPFNLSELIQSITTEMEIIAQQKGMQLVTEIGAENIKNQRVLAPSYMVAADRDRLREVITNLIDNAIKYSKQGQIRVSLTSDKELVMVSVSDNGIGISAEDQSHLFQKFYRVNNSMTREIGGTGLGLYIARNLIERYGGRIWVESKIGKGSTFKFTLPLIK